MPESSSTSAATPVRFRFGVEPYDTYGEGKCWQLWHAEIDRGNAPYCAHKEAGHDGLHEGGGLRWAEQSHAPVELARRFASAARRIPNGNPELWLNDDGSISGTVRGLEQAVMFLGVRGGDD